jgi:hypothetical protein
MGAPAIKLVGKKGNVWYHFLESCWLLGRSKAFLAQKPGAMITWFI